MNWIKTKIRWILVSLGILGVALAAGTQIDLNKTPTLEIDGRTVEFAYTDENKDECLIIRTPQERFTGLGKVEVPIAITNTCGKDDVISLAGMFDKNGHRITKLYNYGGQTTEQVTVNDYGTEEYTIPATATSSAYKATRQVITGTHTEQIPKTIWIPTTLKDQTLAVAKPIPTQFKTTNKADRPITKNETVFLKAVIEFPPPTAGEPKEREFYIVAKGQHGEGILDPTTIFTEDFECGSDGDAFGSTCSWTVDVGADDADLDNAVTLAPTGSYSVFDTVANGSSDMYSKSLGDDYQNATATVYMMGSDTYSQTAFYPMLKDDGNVIGYLINLTGDIYCGLGNEGHGMGSIAASKVMLTSIQANCDTGRGTCGWCNDTDDDCSNQANWNYYQADILNGGSCVDGIDTVILYFGEAGSSGGGTVTFDDLDVEIPGEAAPAAGYTAPQEVIGSQFQ